MARILVADVRSGISRMRRMLSRDHQLLAASTCEGAHRLLTLNQIDLIVCGFAFDDSQMIDFLVDVRRDVRFRKIPFVCWQNEHSELTEACVTGAFNAAAVLGACLCLRFADVNSMTDVELKTALEECLAHDFNDTMTSKGNYQHRSDSRR